MKSLRSFSCCVLALGILIGATVSAFAAGAKSAVPNKQVADSHARGNSPLDNQGGPDAFAYRYVDNQGADTAHYQWIELRGAAQVNWLQFDANSDDYVLAAPIGFSFPFYGGNYTSVNVCTNGNLQFTTSIADYQNVCLPVATINGPMICLYWDDIHLDMGGYNPGGNVTVGTKNFGDYFVVEFDSVGRAVTGNATILKFEAIFWTNGRIKLQYNIVNLDPDGLQEATIGIQSGSTGAHLQYVCNSEGLQPIPNLAMWFYPVPAGTVSGLVRDNESQPIALASVAINELGVSTLTDPSGAYAFPRVTPGVYTMTASRAGYIDQVRNSIQVIVNETATANFVLASSGVQVFPSTNVPVTVADMATATSTISVTPNLTIGDLDVMLNISHTSAEDLIISLRSPTNSTIILSNHNGHNYDDNYTNTVFDDEAAISITEGEAPFTGSFRPESPLTSYDGINAHGTWTLTIQDDQPGDHGTLLAWELRVTEAQAIEQPDGIAPAQFALMGGYPNPFNSTTRINFSLARTAPVTLTLYNIVGQDVATLVNSTLAMGNHEIMWNARDTQGREVPSGIYLMRLTAPGQSATGKLVLMR